MCDNILPDSSIEIVAGDDLTLNVAFRSDGNDAVFETGDTAEMLIHGNIEDIVIHAEQIENNTASFYLSSDLTKSLLADAASESHYEYCIHVKWSAIGQHTPIHRKSLTIKRC